MTAIAVTYPSMLYYTHAQMQRANALRERGQMMHSLTELAGSVAHDFNNLLTSISGYTELAALKLPPGHPAHEDIAQVLAAAGRASLLSGQLLSFAGREVNIGDRVDVTAELQSMAALLQPVLPSGITIHIDAEATPLFIESSISQLQQVLMNILLNAGDAMIDTQGPIEVQLECVAGVVELKVIDHGHGIPDNQLARVFDPFYTTKEGGHGLGLAATSRIMQDIAGDISIRGHHDGGTEVCLTWPEVGPPAQSAKQPSQALPKYSELHSKSSRPGLILVVDDEENVRNIACQLLTMLEYEAVACASAEEAEMLFEREHHRIAAVLLDLKMPGKDGWACLQELRAINESTRVVVCSGFNPSDSLPDFAQDDPNLGLLQKPYRIQELEAVLAELH